MSVADHEEQDNSLTSFDEEALKRTISSSRSTPAPRNVDGKFNLRSMKESVVVHDQRLNKEEVVELINATLKAENKSRRMERIVMLTLLTAVPVATVAGTYLCCLFVGAVVV